MLKLERTCNSRKCDVLINGELVGYMEGVNLTQWFIKNRYAFKGSFSNFITFNHDNDHAGKIVDIVFNDKNLIARKAKIDWINSYGENGTFTAFKMEYYED
jgi:hypothetical protein